MAGICLRIVYFLYFYVYSCKLYRPVIDRQQSEMTQIDALKQTSHTVQTIQMNQLQEQIAAIEDTNPFWLWPR
jgi:hypothetical protein